MLIEPVPLVQLALVDTPRIIAFIRNSSIQETPWQSTQRGGGVARAVANTLELSNTTTTNNILHTHAKRYQASKELLHWMVTSPVVLDSSQFTNRIYESSVSRVVESYQGVCKELWTQLVAARETIADTKKQLHRSNTMGSNVGEEGKSSDYAPQRPFQCSMCSQSYVSCKELQRHTLRRHAPASPPPPNAMLVSSSQHPPADDMDYVRRELASMQQCLRQHLAAAEINVLTQQTYHHSGDLERFTRPPHNHHIYTASESEVDLASKELAVLRYTAESAAMYNYRSSHNELMLMLKEQGKLLGTLEEGIYNKQKSQHSHRDKPRSNMDRRAKRGGQRATSAGKKKNTQHQHDDNTISTSKPDTPTSPLPTAPTPTTPHRDGSPYLRPRPISPPFNRPEIERLALAQRALNSARDLAGY